jgi:septation ring formation regulator EzrA
MSETVQILFMLFPIVIALAVLGMIFKSKIDARIKAKKEAKVQ